MPRSDTTPQGQEVDVDELTARLWKIAAMHAAPSANGPVTFGKITRTAADAAREIWALRERLTRALGPAVEILGVSEANGEAELSKPPAPTRAAVEALKVHPMRACHEDGWFNHGVDAVLRLYPADDAATKGQERDRSLGAICVLCGHAHRSHKECSPIWDACGCCRAGTFKPPVQEPSR